MESADLSAQRAELQAKFEYETISDEDFCGYLMYPKVFTAYYQRKQQYGPVYTLPTAVFFYGMQPGEEIAVDIDPGKTLEIRLQAVSETNDEGINKVFFELNGQPRVISIPNRAIVAKHHNGRKQIPITPITLQPQCPVS